MKQINTVNFEPKQFKQQEIIDENTNPNTLNNQSNLLEKNVLHEVAKMPAKEQLSYEKVLKEMFTWNTRKKSEIEAKGLAVTPKKSLETMT